jgi:hypothetical protein
MRRSVALFTSLLVLITVPAFAAPANDVNVVSDDVNGVFDTDSPRRNQPETAISINPQNPNVIAGGAQDFRRARELRAACGGDRWNGLYFSNDGGGTWANDLIPGYCTDPTQGAGSQQAVSEMFGFSTNTDPVMVFDDFGNLFYSHIAFNADPKRTSPPSTSGVLFVSTYTDTTDGTPTYAETVRVASGAGNQDRFRAGPGFSNFDDKQWMAADNHPTSPFYGRIYVTWTKFASRGGTSTIYISHCGGDFPGQPCDGESWSHGKPVNRPVQGGLVQESFPATAPDGTLYVAFLQFQGGFGSTQPHSGVWVAKSTNGGETFTQRQVAVIRQIPSPIPPQGTAANDGENSFRTGTVPTIGVTDDGAVHLAWGQWDGTSAEVRYVRSTNKGSTWSPQLAMNDAAVGHQFFPNLATTGNSVHVVWYDGRLDPGGGVISALDVFYNRSTNSGASFQPDERITDVSFDPNSVSRFPVFCAAFIGDYIDIDAVGSTVAAIWTDNRNVTDPLTPEECRDYISRSTDPSIQPDLDDGSLDQEAFVEVIPQ